jgi:SAM-dependent methyltransferase
MTLVASELPSPISAILSTMRRRSVYSRAITIRDAADCIFYHVMEIPGHGLVGGQWDLRGGEDEYLGRLDLNGRRVLEIGPASGYLTFQMEARGAEVVAVEVGPNESWDIVPVAAAGPEEVAEERAETMEKLRNGFWFAHERFSSRARVHYGNAANLPPELGRFDVAVIGSILRHARDPLGIVEACSRIADRLVITEPDDSQLRGFPVAKLVPVADAPRTDVWWQFTPDLFVEFTSLLGYQAIELTFHEQSYVATGVRDQVRMFTVVAADKPYV